MKLRYSFSLVLLSLAFASFSLRGAWATEIKSQSSDNVLLECEINPKSMDLRYKFNHAPTLQPDDLKALITKGQRKLADIFADNANADVHELEIFKDYNKHNKNYFKNGVTLTNFCDYIIGKNCESDASCIEIQARIETFISIIWGLVDLSWSRGDQFNRGAIIIQDEKGKLHDYLEKLVLFCAEVDRTQDLNDGIYTIWGSNIGYNRFGKSSHFVNRQITHYGFDARFEPKSFALPVLPFYMTHVLFGRVKNHAGIEVTFIKPEEAGIADLRSLVYHTYCLFAPIPRSNLLRREKDVPKKIARDIASLMHEIWENRESLEFLDGYKGILSIYEAIEADCLTNFWFESSKLYDISWIMELVFNLELVEGLPEKVKKRVELLGQSITDEFCPESLFLRSGSEVLFLDKELLSELKLD